ncbi:ABC transporter ATP-binding protein [Clostridium botulinum]
MLTVKGLCKNYHKFKAVNNVYFDVNEGEIAVLLGPNGAGKSTSIKAIAGLLRFQGEITICGKNNKSLEAKSKFAYVPEVPALYDLLTVYEHIEYMANAYKVNDYKDKAENMLKRFDLWDKKDKLGSELSKGMQQKVSICAALITSPKVILFDEPMIGLDPKAIKELKKVFLELKEEGASVIISTHIIDSISEIWDKALIMKEGNIVFAMTKEELINKNESLEEIFFEVTEG